jgi:curved DNA-binding protein CbpA
MELRDYYKILGIARDATTQEIKTAYRKLSKKFHPDYNPNDKYFEARFREIQEAYHVLSDDELRYGYDLSLQGSGYAEAYQQQLVNVRKKEAELNRYVRELSKKKKELDEREELLESRSEKKVFGCAFFAIAAFVGLIFAVYHFSVTEKQREREKDSLNIYNYLGIDTPLLNKQQDTAFIGHVRIKDGIVYREFPQGYWYLKARTELDPLLNGMWTGQVYRSDYQKDQKVLLRLDLKKENYNLEYPDIGCYGSLQLTDASSNQVEFKEVIFIGLSSCNSGGNIRLQRIGEKKVVFEYYFPTERNLLANGILTKQ